VLNEAPYRRNIPVAVALNAREIERSARCERDHGAAAIVVVARVVIGIGDVTPVCVVNASAVRKPGEEIREAELPMLENPHRYSRKIGMEDLDLAVEVQ
jgi:hypothetical protein